MVCVAENIGSDLMRFAVHLGLPYSHIQHIITERIGTFDATLMILEQWREKDKPEKMLIDALCTIGRRDIVFEMEKCGRQVI